MKELVVYQIRFCGRPVFGQTRSSLRRDWADSPADYVFVTHGDGPVGVDLSSEHTHLDLRGKTDGRISSIGRILFKMAMAAGYKYVALLDDDGAFSDPKKHMTLLLKHLKAKKTAVIGPMDSFVRFRHLGKEKGKSMAGKAVPLDGPPWTTFGCQMYKVAALKKIDLDGLKHVGFRADMYLAHSLRAAGWEAKQVPMAFSHRCSGGYSTKKMSRSRADRKRAQQAVLKTYEFLLKRFGGTELARRIPRMALTDLMKRGMTRKKAKKAIAARLGD